MGDPNDGTSVLTIRLVATADGYPLSGTAAMIPQTEVTGKGRTASGLTLLLVLLAGILGATGGLAGQKWLGGGVDQGQTLPAASACNGYELETGRVAGQIRTLKTSP